MRFHKFLRYIITKPQTMKRIRMLLFYIALTISPSLLFIGCHNNNDVNSHKTSVNQSATKSKIVQKIAVLFN